MPNRLNRIYYAVARAVADCMKAKVIKTKLEGRKKKGKGKIPPWKYRLQKEVSKLRQELSLIDAYRRGVITSEQTIRRVKKYITKRKYGTK